jgi:hypothetical protein
VALQFAGMTPQQKSHILLQVTTPQDLLADLGSPASIYYKEEDKMKIHSDTKESVKNQDEDDGILGSMDDVGGYDRTNRQAEGLCSFISPWSSAPDFVQRGSQDKFVKHLVRIC